MAAGAGGPGSGAGPSPLKRRGVGGEEDDGAPVTRRTLVGLLEELEERQQQEREAAYDKIHNQFKQQCEYEAKQTKTAMREMLATYEKANEDRFDHVEASVRDISNKHDTIEAAQRELKAKVDILAQQLAVAEATTTVEVVTAQQDMAFNRPAKPHVIKINAKEEVTKDSVIPALSGVLATANIGTQGITIDGPEKSKFFTLNFKEGTVGTKARRVNQIFEAVCADGEWVQLEAEVGGRKVRLYLDRDKGPKQEKKEALGRKLAFVVKDKNPTIAGTVTLDKKEAKVRVGLVALARVQVAPGDASCIEWNEEAVTQFSIDKDAIKTAWQLRGGEDNTVWTRG